MISVEAVFPGANARTVIDNIAMPIEHQVDGVEGMTSMSSRSSSDGTYKLEITFKKDMDLNLAQTLVQNRVALSLPALPAAVQSEGVTVKKRSPHVMMFVNLVSPDDRFDGLYLSNYASIQIKDELGRLPGVADIAFFGHRDSRLCVSLDPKKLAQADIAAAEVLRGLEQQNIQVAGGLHSNEKENQPIEILQSRLTTCEDLQESIVKVGANGQILRLKDVGRVDIAQRKRPCEFGRPVNLVLGVLSTSVSQPDGSDAEVLKKMKELQANFPKGLDFVLAFDFAANLTGTDNSTTPEYLLIDVHLPDSASTERIVEVLKRCEKVLLETPGIQHVLVLSEHSSGPSPILVSIAPMASRQSSRKQVSQVIRDRLSQQIQEAYCRVCDPTGSGGYPFAGYPIDFIIEDRGNVGTQAAYVVAEKVVEKLKMGNKLAEVWIDPSLNPNRPEARIDVAREKAAAAGISISDIFQTLEAGLGPILIDNQAARRQRSRETCPADFRPN